MSGVLAFVGKVAGIVASVAAFIPGGQAIAGIAAAVSLVANVGATLTAKTPRQEYSGAIQDLKVDVGAGIPYLMGRCYTGGNVVHRATYGSDNQYYGWVVVYSGGGPVEQFEQFYVDRAPVNFSGSNAVGTFNDYLYLQSQIGAVPEAVQLSMNDMPNWGAGYKLSGYAALAPRFGFDKEGKKFAGGLPAFGAVFKGVKVYDPRLDSTFPGGSGACRPFIESTYVYSQNPWLHCLTYALGRWQNAAEWGGIGRRVLGCGMPLALIGVSSFAEAANVADANGWTIGGVVYSTDDKWNTLKLIAQAGGGEIVSTAGQLTAMVNAPKTSLATITGDDLADGPLTVPATRSRRERINGIIPRHRSEAHFWEIVPQDVIRIDDYVTEDGGERTREREFPLVTNIDQAAELAAYEIFNSREIGPIVLPLKPKWLGYKIGDCLTLDIPEIGLNDQDAIIIGRSLDAATGAITLTFKGETPGKHAPALGTTGVVPPTPSLTYVDPSLVAAPDPDHWSLAGATFTDNGVSIPALVLTRETGIAINPNAEAIVVEFRPYDVGNGDDDGWAGQSVEAYTLERKEFGTVTPGTEYEVSLRYQVRGVVGDRLILGPVTAGDFSTAVQISTVIRSAYIKVGVDLLVGADVSGDGQITIADHDWDYPDRLADVPRTGATLTGLALATRWYVYFDDATLADTTPTYAATTSYATALNSSATPYRHYLDSVDIPALGDPATPGSGGGGGGYGCPADDMYLLTQTGPVAVADIEAGDIVWAKHEIVGRWGWHQIAAVEFFEGECLEATIRGNVYRTSASHLWDLNDGWRMMAGMPGAACIGNRTMARIMVADAHTYWTLPNASAAMGLLSHNKVVGPPDA